MIRFNPEEVLLLSVYQLIIDARVTFPTAKKITGIRDFLSLNPVIFRFNRRNTCEIKWF